MTEQELKFKQEVAEESAEHGWVAPFTEEDHDYFVHLMSVYKRYNIIPSKATRLEYEFVTRVAESEFYLQPAATGSRAFA